MAELVWPARPYHKLSLAGQTIAEQVLPLNSCRIIGGQMQALTAGLDLPTNASREDLTKMIIGKLTNDGRQPSNV